MACLCFEKRCDLNISFTRPYLHFLEVSHSSGRGFPAPFRRGALFSRRRLGNNESWREAGLASLEESAEASGDGGPRKVGLVGGATAASKIAAIGRIREDSNQS